MLDARHPPQSPSSYIGKGEGVYKNPSLDKNGQNCTSVGEWDRKRRRCYQRILSGIKRHRGELLRFLTLTSSNEARRGIGEDFRVLKERIRRLTPYRLIKEGYLTWGELKKFYPNKNLHERIRFEYLKIETSEGNGVLHVLYYGDYIPQMWLSDQWEEIHQSPIVDIRAVRSKEGDKKRLAEYCVNQYCAGQDEFIRYSWSWGWCFKGFVRVWKKLVDEYGLKRAIGLWDVLLETGFLWTQEGIYVDITGPPEICLDWQDWVQVRW